MKKIIAGILTFCLVWSNAVFAQTFPVQNLNVLGTANITGTSTFTGLASFSGGLSSSIPIPITSGGTGASTQSGALSNILGGVPLPIANGGTAASTATTATNNLQFLFPGTGSVARSDLYKFADFLSVKDFGAVGDGVTNDTAAIQQAISVAQALHKYVYLPAATYLVSGTLSVSAPVGIVGEGMGRSIIQITSSQSVPVIQVANGASTAAASSLFKDFTINSTVTTASGCDGLQIQGGINFAVERVQVSGTYNGINVTQATGGAWISDTFVNNTTNNGIMVDAGNMLVKDSWVINCGNYGYYFTSNTNQSAGLIVVGDTAFNNNAGNFIFDGNATHNIIDLIVSNDTASTSPNGPGFRINTYGAYIAISNIICELAGMTSSDVYVSAQNALYVTVNNLGAITITNPMMFGAGGNGIEVDCSYWNLTGGYAVNNNQAAGAQNAGLLIGAAGSVKNFTVTSFNTSVPTGTNSQSYGVNSFTSGSTGIVSNSILHGTTGAFNNNGSTVTFVNNLSV